MDNAMRGFLLLLMSLTLGFAGSVPASAESVKWIEAITVSISDAVYTVTLAQNATSDAFVGLLPTELSMSELNGNEKYHYLDHALPSAPEEVGHINAGDLMLYGDDCVVLFYESFDTGYRYTRIGHIDNAEGLKEALGGASAKVSFTRRTETPVVVTINEMTIPTVLNDTAAARDLLLRLPYSVTLNRDAVDFCGDAGEPFAYDEADYQQGFQYGDLLFMPDGNWFVFFIDGIETYGQAQWLSLGRMDCDMDALRALSGSVTLTVSLP